MAVKGQLVDQYGAPLVSNGHRHDVRELLAAVSQRRGRTAELTYDAARDTDEFKNYWANSDRLDANSANSPGVRGKLVSRSRYESGSNAYYDGLLNTYANYLVGRGGPKLRLLSGNSGFNLAVENTWTAWARVIQFRRKLWTMARAKPTDGEALGVIATNRGVRHRVKLDIKLVETEQCTTPNAQFTFDGYIDGITPDEFGNPAIFHILPQHPGGNAISFIDDAIDVPARFVLHWFQMQRPGQMRGVPEFKSSLNTGASSRRFREATVTAAESAADISILLRTMFPPEEVGALIPFTATDFQKRMMVALPDGWGMDQVKGEHPNSTYDTFLKSQLTETGRPKSFPYNLTACDSSEANFASGKLDREAFYAGLDVDREDGNDTTLDPLFALWWAEAVREYGWNASADEPPPHEWDWPRFPVADVVAEATAIDKDLRNGRTYPSAVYAREGRDFEDELPVMAADYGVTVDEMRGILRAATFNSMNQQASLKTAETQEMVAEQAATEPAAEPTPPPQEQTTDG